MVRVVGLEAGWQQVTLLTSRRYHGRHQLSVYQLCCPLCLSSQEFIDIVSGCINFSLSFLTI